MCRIDPAQGAERASRWLVAGRANAMDVPEAECAPRLRAHSSRKMDPSVLQRLWRKALMSR
jgi:predicted kinase